MKVIKKVLKNNVFCFILGAFIFGVIGVSAATYFASSDVTYDNSESGLSSTNVQGAIDELYGVCFSQSAGDTILDSVDIVTSGDGLYEDEYEEGKYFYKGGNPNNYIIFNNELWRIILVENTGIIKIVRANSIGEFAFDTSGNNDWLRPSSLNTYLNGPYYNGLSNEAQKQIVSYSFSIGPSTFPNDLALEISEENSRIFAGKIAIPIISEYIRTNSNVSKCGNANMLLNNFNICKDTTWMYDSEKWWWTMSTYANGNTTGVYAALTNGYFPYVAENVGRIYPVLYLSSEIKITSGNGSQSDPYQISL